MPEEQFDGFSVGVFSAVAKMEASGGGLVTVQFCASIDGSKLSMPRAVEMYKVEGNIIMIEGLILNKAVSCFAPLLCTPYQTLILLAED